jgi:hypothetical protein
MDAIKGDEAKAEQLQQELSSIEGMQEVQVNPLTGSVLAYFDPASLESVEFQLSIAGALGISLSEIDSDLLSGWTTQYRNGSATGAAETLGPVQLGMLVPFLLLLLGIRGLLFSEKLPFPTWYDYLWFAFGSYFMLNRQRIPSG